jgi:hypothetical protein
MRCYSHLSDGTDWFGQSFRPFDRRDHTSDWPIEISKSAISRELSRNRLPSGRYSPLHATRAYQLRRRRREALIERDRALPTFVVDWQNHNSIIPRAGVHSFCKFRSGCACLACECIPAGAGEPDRCLADQSLVCHTRRDLRAVGQPGTGWQERTSTFLLVVGVGLAKFSLSTVPQVSQPDRTHRLPHHPNS